MADCSQQGMLRRSVVASLIHFYRFVKISEGGTSAYVRKGMITTLTKMKILKTLPSVLVQVEVYSEIYTTSVLVGHTFGPSFYRPRKIVMI